jgi:hypothetical protein
VRKERKQRDGGFEKLLLELKSRLDELDRLLVGRVDWLLLEHGFDPKTLKFDNQPDRKIETNQQSYRLSPSSSPAGESNVPYNLAKPEPEERKTANSFGLTVPPCPICGVNPHDWSIHEKWRHTPGAKGAEKLAADREAYPAHTCVDQPTLSCPACLNWTGDGFATVRNNTQCFPDITDKLAGEAMQYEASGYAVMVRIRLVDRWAWTTWMRYDTYEQAAAHEREGFKIVPFGSPEWTALLQSPEPALPPNATGVEPVHDAVNPPIHERRVDLENRRRTAEMSPEEMQRELLTSEVTGLPNRRALKE